MPDYSHWFPAHKGLTASQYNERAALLSLALQRHQAWSRPAQLVADTNPDHRFKATLGRVFDRWASQRRAEARSALRAALAADDQRADVALLAQLDQALAAARDRAARLARVRPLHRM